MSTEINKDQFPNNFMDVKLQKPLCCSGCKKRTKKLEAYYNTELKKENQILIEWFCETCNKEKYEKVNKEKNTDTVFHFDVFENINQYMIEPFKYTEEGYLIGVAVVTNTGIFRYINSNINANEDTIIRELRTPDEVGDLKSLETLKMIPVTDDHPDEFVNSENAKKLSIGMTGELVKFDGHAVAVTLIITDEKAIKKIKDGKVALSCGYTADILTGGGNAFGNNQYDVEQKNIRYNHIALVERGRAGDLARIKFNRDNYNINENFFINKINKGVNMGENLKNTKSAILTFDGITFRDVDPDLFKEVRNIQDNILELEKTLEIIKEKNVKLQASNDALDVQLIEKDALLKQEKEKNKKIDIFKAVKNRLAVITVAEKIGINYNKDTENELSNIEIKKKIIDLKYPDSKITEKEDIYINAFYDSIVLNMQSELNTENKEKVFTDNIPKPKNVNKNEKSEREKYLDSLHNRAENYNGAVNKGVK